jgi:Tol biopolymer transport system component
VRISPDGRRIATTIVDPHSGTKDIWTLDLAADPAHATTTRITFGDTDYGWPAWSPDGNKLVFNADRDGAPHLFTADAAGGSAPQQLLPPSAWQIPFDWSAKGVMYGEIVPKRRFDLKLLAGGQSSTWLGTPFNDSMGRVSPDGRWVAYLSRDSQESGDELFVRSFDRTGERVRISHAVGELPPVWRGDGRELFYLSPDNELFAVPIAAAGNTLTAGEPVRLFALPPEAADFDATADGKRFLVRVDDKSLPPALRVVMNWKAEVEGELARK